MSIINLAEADKKLLCKRLDKIEKFMGDMGVPTANTEILPNGSGLKIRIDIQLNVKADIENLLQIAWAMERAESRMTKTNSAALRTFRGRK